MKMYKVDVTPQELQRSCRLGQGPASSFTHLAMPQVIELDEEEEKIIEKDGQVPYDPRVNVWISNFDATLMRVLNLDFREKT